MDASKKMRDEVKGGCDQGEDDKRNGNVIPDDGLETEQERKERWISVYIVYFTMFLISLGFSIILTGVWPYLDKLDPTAGKEFMGYVVAANPLAQMLFSPLVGWWSNRLGTIRLPLLSTLAVFTIASAMYSSLELFGSHHKYWMLFTRFLVGVSSGNIAACRSYVSAATRLTERTKAVAMISLAQVLGFIIGPALQAAVVPFGDDGMWLVPNVLKINMYTASGWINVLLSTFNFCLFLPYFFKEHKIAGKEAMLQQGVKTEKETWAGSKVDQLSAWTLIVAFFVLVFNFMLLETLGAPLTMDQFAWSKAEALYYMGILMSVGGVIAIICFAMINPLCRWFPENKVMIWGGFFFMVLGRAVFIPWGDTTPKMYDDSIRLNLTVCDSSNLTSSSEALSDSFFDAGNTTFIDSFVSVNNETFNEDMLNCNMTEPVGCPMSQKWCEYTRVMTMSQFILGYFLTAFGYPIGVTLIQTIFSKILGPRPQGVWMGLLTGSGCLSRVMGPVFVTYIYTEYGTNWTFGFTTVMMLLSMFWLVFFTDRLAPKQLSDADDEEGTELKSVNKFVHVSLTNVNET